MTEIEHVTHTNHLPTRADPPGGLPALGAGVAALQRWAETAQAAASLVGQMVDTPFFPAGLIPKATATTDQAIARQRAGAIANGTGAILYGVEIGLSPMQALNNVIVIKGKPSLYADTMVALVQAAGHEIWTVESTETRAVVCGRRAGSEQVETVEFTMERARKAGYAQRNENYQKDPIAMLYARAASIACRRTAPEVLKGIPAFEEIQDDTRTQRPGAPPVAAPPVTVAEITGAVEDEPTPLDEPEPENTAHVDPIRRGQQNRMFALFDSLGMGGKDDASRAARLRVASAIVNRQLESSNDLTEDEGHTLIDSLALYEEAGADGAAQLAALAARDHDGDT